MTTWRSLQAFDAARPWALDLALAGGLLAASLAAAWLGPGLTLDHALLLVAGAAPYAWRRAAPVLVLVVAAAGVLALLMAGHGTAVIGSGLFLAAYTVAARHQLRTTALAGAFCAAVLAVVAVAFPGQLTPGEAATNLALFAGAFAVGRATRTGRAAARVVADRAALAERVQAEQARTALTEERLRIARELHDVVGHSLAVIALQASVGERVAATEPDEARSALAAIAERSRESLQEVRRLVAGMRDETGSDRPLPGLADLPGLVADMGAAGLTVSVETAGEPWPLSPALDLTAYRVLQESLTNVVRHAGTDTAEVRIRYTPDDLELTVGDHGRGPAVGATHGNGQAGMRERVATWGGRLETGAAPDGGYRVVAVLPRRTEDQ